MSTEYRYKQISTITADIAAGGSTITALALQVHIYINEVLFIQTPRGRMYRTKAVADCPIGTTTLRIQAGVGDEYDLNNIGKIPAGSIILLPDVAVNLYARKAYDNIDRFSYINFSSQAVCARTWTTFSSSGISNHSWNTVTSDEGTTMNNISTQIQATGIVMPRQCIVVGIRATTYRVGNLQSAVALFKATPKYNDNDTQNFTRIAYAEADNSAGPDSNYSQRPVAAIDLSANNTIAAGDVILPAFKGVSNTGGNFRANYTIVLKEIEL